MLREEEREKEGVLKKEPSFLFVENSD